MFILLNTIEKVKLFSEVVGKYDGEITAIQGNYSVNAKSIIGIFGCDILKPIRLEISEDVDGLKEDLDEIGLLYNNE